MPKHQSDPALGAYLMWLEQLRDRYIATYAPKETATQAELRHVLHQLREVRNVLAGTGPPEESLMILRRMLAIGMLKARPLLGEQLPDLTAETVSNLLIAGVVSAALEPLVLSRSMPVQWETILQTIASDDIVTCPRREGR